MLLFLSLSAARAQSSAASCFASLQDSVLTMGNERFTLAYDLSGGHVRLLHYQLLGKSKTVFEQAPIELNVAPTPIKGSGFVLETKPKAVFTGENEFLEVSLEYKLGGLDVKRVWAIYPAVAALSTQYFFKGKVPSSGWFKQKATTSSSEMIEDAAALATTEGATSYYGSLPLNGPHWIAKVVAFTDATDNHNNLVDERTFIPYIKASGYQGNLLLLRHKHSQSGLFILKQAPLAFHQQAYPGHDFIVDKHKVLITGSGLSAGDIHPDGWASTYSYVLGFSGHSELDQLTTLRLWQKQQRQLRPARDEMIMSNTWGDRSKDAKMNEGFVLQELEAAARLGITHFQLDDGWQEGLSKNSAEKQGMRWNNWTVADWQPSQKRFPNGLGPIVQKASKLGIGLGLWFNPGSGNDYQDWKRSADVLIGYYERYGIKVFKIDGVDLPNKESEENLRKLLQRVSEETDGNVTFNLDVTAGRRAGYHFLTAYGNIFLENRYTDWGNYYPHQTLRNLWSLAAYVPLEKIQAEWLNAWRNKDKYPIDDPLAPSNMPWDYLMATTWAAQPLAWMEVSALPGEAQSAADVLQQYRAVQHELHQGILLPIGHVPDGCSWTGFQSSTNGNQGFLLVFREKTDAARGSVKTYLPKGKRVKLIPVAGKGKAFKARVKEDASITFSLPSPFSYALYKYVLY